MCPRSGHNPCLDRIAMSPLALDYGPRMGIANREKKREKVQRT